MYRVHLEINKHEKLEVDIDADTEEEMRAEVETDWCKPWRRMFGADGVRIMRFEKIGGDA